MIKYTFICLKDFVYGYNPDDFVFRKNNSYKVEIDYDMKKITLFNYDGRWVKFYMDSGFHTGKFIPNFIEQSELRKQKIEKLNQTQ